MNRLDEKAKAVIWDLLYLSNQARDLDGYLKGLTAQLSEWTGFEAVGVRLVDGEDYPYYETHGFPRQFVEMERHLCSYDKNGNIVRDPGGKPYLECMCGNVICGRVDPSKFFFTENGSFFSNCTTRLLATTSDKDRQARTRNRCNGEGYESVGLVALRTGGRTIGLLQFNDRREGRFETMSIHALEAVADVVAVTIGRIWSEEALKRSEERYRTLFDNMREGFAYCRMIYHEGSPADFVYIAVNRAFEDLTGLSGAVGKKVSQLIPGIRKSNPEIFEIYGRVALSGKAEKFETYVPPLGIWFSVSVYSPAREYFIAVFENISARKAAEEALKASEKKYRGLFESSRDAILTAEPPGWRFASANPAALSMFGLKSVEDIRSLGPADISPETQPDGRGSAEKAREMIGIALERGYHSFEWTHRRMNGDNFPAAVLLSRMETAGKAALQASVRDLTSIKKAEAEENRLKGQISQLQKMESIGRLAGGVAHDFNNMLSIIIGYADLILEDLGPGAPLRPDMEEILYAAQRSRALTQQLLAFARRQNIEPKVIDLNGLIENMKKMLGRLVGEDIDIRFVPQPGLWPVFMDPSQVDQILANLAVNARDAVTGVGKITLETKNVDVDATYCVSNPEASPGEYVMLGFSDSGVGMSPEVMARAFEPFFTTKAEGKGTGLGLATVYGIVKQNSGFINTYSEPGQGTTFRIYIPARRGAAPGVSRGAVSSPAGGGTETILVVEDEKQILTLCGKVLAGQGYTVLAAGDPEEALALCREHEGPIHLLITDVIMPGMNGKDLKERIERIKPKIKTLFMSGYTSNVIAHHGVLSGEYCFMQKPFTLEALSSKVREALAR